MLRFPISLFAGYALAKTCESALQEGFALSGSPVGILLVGGILFLLGCNERRIERSRKYFAERVVD